MSLATQGHWFPLLYDPVHTPYKVHLADPNHVLVVQVHKITRIKGKLLIITL